MKKIISLIFIIGVMMIIFPIFLNLRAKHIENNLIDDYRKKIEYKSESNSNKKESNITNNNYKNINKLESNELNTKEKDVNIIGILKIPAIGLEAPIRLGEENLNYVIAKYRDCPSFGEAGNVILAGHNNMKGSVFKNLHKLEKNDSIFVEADNKIYEYKIYEKLIVEPNDSKVLKQDLKSKEVTLITCTNHAKQRLIIKGEFEN